MATTYTLIHESDNTTAHDRSVTFQETLQDVILRGNTPKMSIWHLKLLFRFLHDQSQAQYILQQYEIQLSTL